MVKAFAASENFFVNRTEDKPYKTFGKKERHEKSKKVMSDRADAALKKVDKNVQAALPSLNVDKIKEDMGGIIDKASKELLPVTLPTMSRETQESEVEIELEVELQTQLETQVEVRAIAPPSDKPEPPYWDWARAHDLLSFKTFIGGKSQTL